MKGYFLAAALLAVLGVGLSTLLVPRQQELALMRLKDKDFDEARREYEIQLAAGKLTASVVMPLTQLYLQYGNVTGAVALMERFVAANPVNVEARQRLGVLYQYAQRPDDYLENLEAANRVQATEDNLRRLSSIYNYQARYDKQIEALSALVEMSAAKTSDYVDLARLQASLQQLPDAVATLQRMEARFPQAIYGDLVELLVSVLLDSGEPRAAFDRALSWLGQSPRADDVARFASQLAARGQPTLGAKLIEPYERLAETNPVLLTELTRIDVSLDRVDAAFNRLFRLRAENRLPAAVVGQFIELALNRQDLGLALDLAAKADIGALSGWVLTSLADAAMGQGREAFVQSMVDRLGDSFLAARPVLAASLALSRGDAASAARWIAIAEANASLSLDQRLGLAGVYRKAGRDRDGLQLLARLADSGELPEGMLDDLAATYIEMRAATEGMERFAKLRRDRPSLQVEGAWARLAARAGRAAEILEWLKRPAAIQTERNTLIDLFYAGIDSDNNSLALAASEILWTRDGQLADRRRLAEALLAADRPTEALPHLREIYAADPSVRELYAAALTQARAAGLPVVDEMKAFFVAQLGEPALPEARETEIIWALLDLDVKEPLLSLLKARARRIGDPWVSVFLDTARTLGAKEDAIAFLGAELDRGDLPREKSEERLYALLEWAGEEASLPYLRRFADSPGGNWVFAYEDTLERLGRISELRDHFLKRLTEGGLGIEARSGLVYRLFDLDAYDRVLPVVAGWARDSGDPWASIYLDGAKRGGRNDAAITFLRDELDRPGLAVEAAEQRLYALLEWAGEETALPYLRRFADTQGGNWVFAYEGALEHLGRRVELRDHVLKRLAAAGPAIEARSGLVYRLFDLEAYDEVLPIVAAWAR